jgi:hypothetical protein
MTHMELPRLTGSVARLAAGSRMALGMAVLARPEGLVRAMRVDAATARRVAWLSRMLGARDLALGAGTLYALVRGGDHRSWLLASGVADAVDAAAVGAAARQRQVAAAPAVLTVAVAAGSAALHLAAAAER